MIQFSDYLCGGYFLTRPVKRKEDWNAPFLPDSIVSISKDIGDFVPDSWLVEWTQDSPEKPEE